MISYHISQILLAHEIYPKYWRLLVTPSFNSNVFSREKLFSCMICTALQQLDEFWHKMGSTISTLCKLYNQQQAFTHNNQIIPQMKLNVLSLVNVTKISELVAQHSSFRHSVTRTNHFSWPMMFTKYKIFFPFWIEKMKCVGIMR